MTAKQKAELKGYVAWSTSAGRTVAFLFFGFCIAAVSRYLVEHTKRDASYLWWAVPTLLMMGFVYFWSKRWTGGREFRRQVKADLEQGTVAVHQIDIVDAIEVEEREDEGPSYFVKTGDGSVLVFTGQYLDGYRRRRFPWKSFEILEGPVSKMFFGFKKLDVPFVPSFVREPFSWDEFKEFQCMRYKMVEIDFEKLKVKQALHSSAPKGTPTSRSKGAIVGN